MMDARRTVLSGARAPTVLLSPLLDCAAQLLRTSIVNRRAAAVAALCGGGARDVERRVRVDDEKSMGRAAGWRRRA